MGTAENGGENVDGLDPVRPCNKSYDWGTSLSGECLQEIARHVGVQGWGTLRCVCQNWRRGISQSVRTVRLTVPDRSTAPAVQPPAEPAAADAPRPNRRGTAVGRPTGRGGAAGNHQPPAAVPSNSPHHLAPHSGPQARPQDQQLQLELRQEQQPSQQQQRQQPTATGRGFAASNLDLAAGPEPAAACGGGDGDASFGRIAVIRRPPVLEPHHHDLEPLACVFNLHRQSTVEAAAARMPGEASDSHAAGVASSVGSSSIVVWSFLEAADKLASAFPLYDNLNLNFAEPLPLAVCGGGGGGGEVCNGRWLQSELSTALQRVLTQRLVSLTLSGHTPYPLFMAPPPLPMSPPIPAPSGLDSEYPQAVTGAQSAQQPELLSRQHLGLQCQSNRSSGAAAGAAAAAAAAVVGTAEGDEARGTEAAPPESNEGTTSEVRPGDRADGVSCHGGCERSERSKYLIGGLAVCGSMGPVPLLPPQLRDHFNHTLGHQRTNLDHRSDEKQQPQQREGGGAAQSAAAPDAGGGSWAGAQVAAEGGSWGTFTVADALKALEDEAADEGEEDEAGDAPMGVGPSVSGARCAASGAGAGRASSRRRRRPSPPAGAQPSTTAPSVAPYIARSSEFVDDLPPAQRHCRGTAASPEAAIAAEAWRDLVCWPAVAAVAPSPLMAAATEPAAAARSPVAATTHGYRGSSGSAPSHGSLGPHRHTGEGGVGGYDTRREAGGERGGSGVPYTPGAADGCFNGCGFEGLAGSGGTGDGDGGDDVMEACDRAAALAVLLEANGSGRSSGRSPASGNDADGGGGCGDPVGLEYDRDPMDTTTGDLQATVGFRYCPVHYFQPDAGVAAAAAAVLTVDSMILKETSRQLEGGGGGVVKSAGGGGGSGTDGRHDGGGGSSDGRGSRRGASADGGGISDTRAAGGIGQLAASAVGIGGIGGGVHPIMVHQAQQAGMERLAAPKPAPKPAAIPFASFFTAGAPSAAAAVGGAVLVAGAGVARAPPLLSRLTRLVSLTIAADVRFPSPQQLEAITALSGLQRLDMRGAKFMQVDGDASQQLGRQTWLHLGNDHVAVVARCTSLTSLSLNHMHAVAGAQLVALTALSRLTSLGLTDALSGNAVYGSHIKALAAGLSHLRSLDIGRVTCPPLHLPPQQQPQQQLMQQQQQPPGGGGGVVLACVRSSSPADNPHYWQPWGSVLGLFQRLTSLHLQVACSFETDLLVGVAALPLLENLSMELLDVPPPQLAAMLEVLAAGSSATGGGGADSGSPPAAAPAPHHRHGRRGGSGAAAAEGGGLSRVLRGLTLTACMLYDEHLELMGRLRQLRSIQLEQVDIRTRDPDGWTALSGARSLEAFSFREWNNPVLSASNLCVLTNDSLAIMAANWPKLQTMHYCGKVSLTEKAEEHLARMANLTLLDINGTDGTAFRVWRSAADGQLLRSVTLPYNTTAKVSSRNGYVTYSDSDDSSDGSEASVNWMGEMGCVTSEYDAD